MPHDHHRSLLFVGASMQPRPTALSSQLPVLRALKRLAVTTTFLQTLLNFNAMGEGMTLG